MYLSCAGNAIVPDNAVHSAKARLPSESKLQPDRHVNDFNPLHALKAFSFITRLLPPIVAVCKAVSYANALGHIDTSVFGNEQPVKLPQYENA